MSVRSLVGQSIVGQYTATGWWPGIFEITQGWGASGYSGEPEGHGFQHWHAGADIGAPCGTVITLPSGIPTAVVRAVDNPGGYGTALVVTIGNVDIWLGHLSRRLVANGTVRGGTALATSNNSGNSTGCHVHIEVRPRGQKYGTDIDPSLWVLDPLTAAANAGAAPSASSSQQATLFGVQVPNVAAGAQTAAQDIEALAGDPLAQSVSRGVAAAFGPVAQSIQTAEQQFMAGVVGIGQVGLGSFMMLGGTYFLVQASRGVPFARAATGPYSSIRRLVGQAVGVETETPKPTNGAAQEQAVRKSVRTEASQQTEAFITARRARLAEQAGVRKETMGAFRAGLISQKEAQRRLGLPMRRVGNSRPIAYGRGVTGTGRYAKADIVTPASGHGRGRSFRQLASNAGMGTPADTRAAAVRASRIRGAKIPAVSEPPF